QAKTEDLQRWVKTWGQWLFNQDRQNLQSLSAEEAAIQPAVAVFQKSLKEKSPGDFFFLCLMSIPRELRDQIYAAKLEELPEEIIICR
ncbi:hypothetical protein K458DRAFT_267217, partial [Lentithecium fluviatile CBS 122367]